MFANQRYKNSAKSENAGEDMTKKESKESKEHSHESNRDNHCWNRREFLKILPAAYIAPATLMLVTADRATAQSRCTEVEVDLDNISTSGVTVQYTNNAGSQSRVVLAGTVGVIILACLGSTITFTAGASFEVLWACTGGGSGLTVPGTSHTLTVETSDCGFLLRD
jgi:hypothetical protein